MGLRCRRRLGARPRLTVESYRVLLGLYRRECYTSLVLKGKSPLLRTPRVRLHRELLFRRELGAGLSLGQLRGAYHRPACGLMGEVTRKGVFRLHAREQVILRRQVERRRSPPGRGTRPVVLDKCQLCPRVAVTNAARHGPVKVLLT